MADENKYLEGNYDGDFDFTDEKLEELRRALFGRICSIILPVGKKKL